MKICEGGREGGGLFKRMEQAQLIQGFSDQTKSWQMPIFLFRLLS